MGKFLTAVQAFAGIFFTFYGYFHKDGYALALGGILWIEASIFSGLHK